MPSLVYSNEMSVGGPWLLDSDALEQLDVLIDGETSRLEEYREERLTRYVEETLEARNRNYPSLKPKSEEEELKKRQEIREDKESYFSFTTGVAIALSDGGVYTAERFKDALRDPDLVEKTPVGFKLNITCGEIRARVDVERGNDRLRLSASPEASREAKELFVSLRQWVSRYSAPFWQRMWSSFAGWHWMAYVLLVVIVAIATVPSTSHELDAAKQRARKLLDSGVTAQNAPEAVQLLLALNVGYDPSAVPQPEPSVPSWVRVLVWGGLGLSIVVQFKPNVLLGIGKGSARINAWRVWLKVVGIGLPSLIVTTIVWPWVVGLLGAWFR